MHSNKPDYGRDTGNRPAYNSNNAHAATRVSGSMQVVEVEVEADLRPTSS